jgi:peptidoglycan/xylan/chitin deacetylase (PgdA/CDA1 family)
LHSYLPIRLNRGAVDQTSSRRPAQPSTAIAVLMYHSISSVPDGALHSLAIPPALLREQLTALVDAGYRLVGLTEAIKLRAAGAADPIVALTFDDGYVDFLDEGVGLLAELGATATLYMAVGHTGQPASWLGPRAAQFPPLMSWGQLREVAAAGIEVGSHSLVHHPLDVLAPPELYREVGTAAKRLTQELQRPVQSFCYPHGYHGRRVRAAVRAAGYRNACAIGRRLYMPDDDALAIPRLQPTPEHSGSELLRLVRTGGPQLAPRLKDLAQPSWRVTRRLAGRYLGVRLT